jgi:predicted RNase H-like HicB family nuclease
LKVILAMSPFTGDSCSSVGASLDAILSEGIADLCRHYPVEGGDDVTAEILITVEIEPLDEGGYLATSKDLPGLVAQGRTLAETLEIAQDVARKIIESHIEHGDPLPAKIAAALKRQKGRVRATVAVGVPTMRGVP